MKIARLFFFTFLILSIFTCDDEPFDPIVHGTLKGIVLNNEDLSPIPGALASTIPVSESVLTNDSGNFVLGKVVVGEYEVLIEVNGYNNGRESVIIVEDDTSEITILLNEKTESNLSPDPPFDEFPVHYSEEIDLQVRLSWSANDANDDSLLYDVKLYSSENPEFTTMVSNSSDTYLDLTDLSYGKTYLWQVIVKDGVSDPVNGPVWQFKTKDFPNNRILFSRMVDNTYQIFSGDENGSEIQLTYSQNHSWRPSMNPERTKISFISFDGIDKHLFQMERDGSNIQKITQEVPVASFDDDFMNYCWSPNGASLVYMHYNKLYKIDFDGSSLELLIAIENNLSFSYVDWTDAVKPIIAVRTSAPNNYDGDIYLIDLDGTLGAHIFVNQIGRTGAGTFSIDGSNILYTHDMAGFEGQNGRQLDAHIVILDLNTFAVTDLSIGSKPAGTNDLDPRYSPDGASIIFVNTNNDGSSVKNIYKMNLEGERVLLFENAEMPNWR